MVRITRSLKAALCALLILSVMSPAFADETNGETNGETNDGANDGAKQKRAPDQFAIIYIKGYAGDHFPTDKTAFETIVASLKEMHYNTILCRYEPWREEICKKYGIKIMVDLLAPGHHVYKNVDGVKALCESLPKSDNIYAYHLWSDRVGGTTAGRSRDIRNVQSWDPHHPTYLGDYKASSLAGLENPDIIGYYDFHWSRLGHFRHLFRCHTAAKKHGVPWLKYADGTPGRVGVGNYNRVLYTISTSIAFGLKGYMFHYRGGVMNEGTGDIATLGRDWQRVNSEYVKIGPEIIKIGVPSDVFSTPITKTAKDRDTGKPEPFVPGEFQPIPEGGAFEVLAGEAIVGVFQHEDGSDALFFANHNSYQPQAMKVKIADATRVSLCDRKTGEYRDLTIAEGVVSFEIPPAAGELLKITR